MHAQTHRLPESPSNSRLNHLILCLQPTFREKSQVCIMNFLPTSGLAQITRPRWKFAATTSLENLVVSRLREKTKLLTRDGVKCCLETG